jgi:ATP-dependent Clp protease ATP-binding subunit ClpC
MLPRERYLAHAIQGLVATGELRRWIAGQNDPTATKNTKRHKNEKEMERTMFRDFSERANKVFDLAREEARRVNHEYIGTEHVLLGLVAEGSGVAANVLQTLGVSRSAIADSVESFVQRGTESVASRTLPLTPRTKQVIEFAREEARGVGQTSVDTEHLLLALFRECDGVASHVLRKLGVKPEELRAEALKTRIEMMKAVERSVRPVRASIVRKRKMREELFAHLSAVFEEELVRVSDPKLALERAARRLGEPVELARELEDSLPVYERFSAFVERWLQYRAPESAARYSLRQSGYTFCLLLAILVLVTLGVFFGYGWIEAVQLMVRVFVAILLLTPPLQFVVSWAVIKMRDAMFGAFGSRKSPRRVLALGVLIAVAAEIYLMGVAALARMDFSVGLDAARVAGVISVVAAIGFGAIAYCTGRETIRDTQWALLDIETA